MKKTLEGRLAQLFSMTDQVWKRHANPWSVWTRFSVLPLLTLAIWSRAWIYHGSWICVGIVFVWAWLNPRIFPKPKSTQSWASKAVLGERVWLNRKEIPVPKTHQAAPQILILITSLGLPLYVYGLWVLQIWPTLTGIILIYVGKAWFLDRMVWLFQDTVDSHEEYRSWLY